MRPQGSPEQLEKRRTRAMVLLEHGYQPVEIGRKLGVDRRSVRRWKAAYLRNGREGIRARSAPGRPPKLNHTEKGQLEKALLRGAQAAGFLTDLWTCPRVAALIQAQFGIRYHVDHIGRLLHGLGWSPQKPARRAIERDETGIQQWVKQEWPRIKKKPAD
jgi:transposase